MTYSYTFKWSDNAPESVKVTGSFNNWQEQLPLTRTDEGFELNVKVQENDKVFFKFVVDGEWCINPAYQIASDNGIENNFVGSEDLHLFEEFEEEPATAPEPQTATSHAMESTTGTEKEPVEESAPEIHSVSTSESSFAAVSIPSDKFEEIEPSTLQEVPENLSDSNSTLNRLQAKDTPKDTSKDELRMPGTYPVGSAGTASSPGSVSGAAGISDDTPSKRRENLISRFRGLFKY